MPMHFPDLESVQNLVRDMQGNKGDKQYKGIYPETEEQLPRARIELARYLREVWRDDVFAAEVEMAVTKENYEQKMKEHVMRKLMGRLAQ